MKKLGLGLGMVRRAGRGVGGLSEEVAFDPVNVFAAHDDMAVGVYCSYVDRVDGAGAPIGTGLPYEIVSGQVDRLYNLLQDNPNHPAHFQRNTAGALVGIAGDLIATTASNRFLTTATTMNGKRILEARGDASIVAAALPAGMEADEGLCVIQLTLGILGKSIELIDSAGGGAWIHTNSGVNRVRCGPNAGSYNPADSIQWDPAHTAHGFADETEACVLDLCPMRGYDGSANQLGYTPEGVFGSTQYLHDGTHIGGTRGGLTWSTFESRASSASVSRHWAATIITRRDPINNDADRIFIEALVAKLYHEAGRADLIDAGSAWKVQPPRVAPFKTERPLGTAYLAYSVAEAETWSGYLDPVTGLVSDIEPIVGAQIASQVSTSKQFKNDSDLHVNGVPTLASGGTDEVTAGNFEWDIPFALNTDLNDYAYLATYFYGIAQNAGRVELKAVDGSDIDFMRYVSGAIKFPWLVDTSFFDSLNNVIPATSPTDVYIAGKQRTKATNTITGALNLANGASVVETKDSTPKVWDANLANITWRARSEGVSGREAVGALTLLLGTYAFHPDLDRLAYIHAVRYDRLDLLEGDAASKYATVGPFYVTGGGDPARPTPAV